MALVHDAAMRRWRDASLILTAACEGPEFAFPFCLALYNKLLPVLLQSTNLFIQRLLQTGIRHALLTRGSYPGGGASCVRVFSPAEAAMPKFRVYAQWTGLSPLLERGV